MPEFPDAKDWAELRSRKPLSDDQFAALDVPDGSSSRGMLLAIDGAGDLHLMIPLRAPALAEDPADLNGIKVRRRPIGEELLLDLISPASNERVFTAMCAEIIEAVAHRKREPSAATAATIRKWQESLRAAKPEMEKSVQVGLVGELFILNRLMLPCLGSVAIGQWSGPAFERHDFVSGVLHIEVKTTRKSKHEHEVSLRDQLDVPPAKSLFLASVLLEETIGGDVTLATLIDEITASLQDDFAALTDFNDKIGDLGWSDGMRQSGELMRFFVRAVAVFEVDDEFPRLPEGFILPSGVIAVRYTISLANLPSLDGDEVMDRVRSANGV